MKNSRNVVFGTGPLGLWVMRTLVERGKQVTVVNRRGRISQKLPDQVRVEAGEATDANAVYQLCKEAHAVFHCAMPPYTQWPEKLPALTRGILEGVARTGAKLVYGDNLYMYGDTEGKPISENAPYGATGRKGKVRAQVATMLLEAHKKGDVPVVIGRGSDFYGPNVVNSTFGEHFFKAALSGKTADLLGDIGLPHTYTYIRDFAKALVELSDNDTANGQVWHVSNAETITTRQIVAMVEKELEMPIKVRTAGRSMVFLLGLVNPMMREIKEMMYEWEKPYIVDHSKYAQAFGAESTPHRVAVKETVDWYRQRFSPN